MHFGKNKGKRVLGRDLLPVYQCFQGKRKPGDGDSEHSLKINLILSEKDDILNHIKIS